MSGREPLTQTRPSLLGRAPPRVSAYGSCRWSRRSGYPRYRTDTRTHARTHEHTRESTHNPAKVRKHEHSEEEARADTSSLEPTCEAEIRKNRTREKWENVGVGSDQVPAGKLTLEKWTARADSRQCAGADWSSPGKCGRRRDVTSRERTLRERGVKEGAFRVPPQLSTPFLFLTFSRR